MCLVAAVGLAVAYRVVSTGAGYAKIGAVKPVDVSTTESIDPLARAAGLTMTRENHDEGDVNAVATWSKTYTAPSGLPACVAVMDAAAQLGYTPSAGLGVTAANCVEQSGRFGSGGTILTTPSGQASNVSWTLDPPTVTMKVEGPQSS